MRTRPLGVVGVIGPWNYPFTHSSATPIRAMMAGNAVLLKPSEVTPLRAMLVGEMLRERGPAGERVPGVPGDGETAAAMIDEVDFVMFTGSIATGRKVMSAPRRRSPRLARAGRQGPDDRVRGR